MGPPWIPLGLSRRFSCCLTSCGDDGRRSVTFRDVNGAKFEVLMTAVKLQTALFGFPPAIIEGDPVAAFSNDLRFPVKGKTLM